MIDRSPAGAERLLRQPGSVAPSEPTQPEAAHAQQIASPDSRITRAAIEIGLHEYSSPESIFDRLILPPSSAARQVLSDCADYPDCSGYRENRKTWQNRFNSCFELSR